MSRLADSAGKLSADQAEHALSRLRESGYPVDHPTTKALLDRLEQTAGKRTANRARKWFHTDTSARDERRANRQAHGTIAEQRTQYQGYVAQLATELEAATRGAAVTRQMRGQHALGRGMSLERILASNPATMRKHLSAEALQHLGEHGRPLSFDAWRYAHTGARDPRAVESYTKRNQGYLSEWG